jgi:pyruvate/2-oxoglutarate dehydrogenase complex dihydrolipoamide acyltransferase (E2) component
VSERAQNLQQQIQQQTIQSAQDFYGESLGRIKGQLQSDRAQLEILAEQMPSEEAQAQIQELVDAYEAIESSLDQSAQDLGVEDTVNQALQQAQEAVGQVAGQAQEAGGQVVGQVAQGVKDTAGRAAGQAQEAVGGAAQQAQEAVGGGDQEEEPDATEAARQKADELGVDLSQVEGSGSGGRITIKDVQSAAKQG